MTPGIGAEVAQLLNCLGYKAAAESVSAAATTPTSDLQPAREALAALAVSLLQSGHNKDQLPTADRRAISVLRNLLQTNAYVPRHILRTVGTHIARDNPTAQRSLLQWAAAATPSSSPVLPSSLPQQQQHSDGLHHNLSSFYVALVEQGISDPTDEYRDDDDPGYRIRDLWESELVEEIRLRESGAPAAALIPYAPAFSPNYMAPTSTVGLKAAVENPTPKPLSDCGRVSPSFGGGSNDQPSPTEDNGVNISNEFPPTPGAVSCDDELALCSSTSNPHVDSYSDMAAVPCSNSTDWKDAISTAAVPTAVTTSDTPLTYDDDDGSAWREEYCDGDVTLHLARRQAEFQKIRASLAYANSEVHGFPRVCGASVFDCFCLKVVYDRDRTGFESSREFSSTMPGDVIAGRYAVQRVMGRAAFSIALMCHDQLTGEEVCLKIIKNDKDFLDQSLDEIKLLLHLSANGELDAVHILKFKDALYFKEHLILVTELLQDNLYDFSRRGLRRWYETKDSSGLFTLGRLQRVCYEVLLALRFVHSLGLMHLDLKPENVLFSNTTEFKVKLIDFGSSCFLADQLSLYVQSRSYRSPEVLLGLPYDSKVDLWSLGCVVAELWTGFVLFQNDSVAALLARIVGILGPLPYYTVVQWAVVQWDRILRRCAAIQGQNRRGCKF